MNTKMDKRGSEWRIWDLHVHSPASGFGCDDDYPTFIESINKSVANVIGINDYSTLEGYKKIITSGLPINKVVFPVIEFRMNNKLNNKASSKNNGGTNINFHIIIDNNLDISKVEFEINTLECFGKNGYKTKLAHIEKSDYDKITFDFFDTIKTLNKSNILKDRFLVWVPYDEYGGIDEIDPNIDGFFKLGILNSTNIIGSANQKQIDFFKSEKCLKVVGKNFPCIKGCDSHNVDYPFGMLKDAESNPTDKYCWIKADMTFEGLKQIVYEPKQRVRIQKTEPDVKDNHLIIDEVRFICSDKTFTDRPIYFNRNLNVIIGGKSSGKSLLLTCIAEVLKGKTDINKYELEKIAGDFDFEVKLLSDDLFDSLSNHKDERQPSIIPEIKYVNQNQLVELANPMENKRSGELNDEIRKLLKEDEAANDYYASFLHSVKNYDRDRESIINEYFETLEKKTILKKEIFDFGSKSVIESTIKEKTEKIKDIKIKVGLTIEQEEKYNKLKSEIEQILNEIKQIESNVSDISRYISKYFDIFKNAQTEAISLNISLNPEIKQQFKSLFESINAWVENVFQSNNYLESEIGKNFISTLIKTKNEQIELIQKGLEQFVEKEENKKNLESLEENLKDALLKKENLEKKEIELNNIEIELLGLKGKLFTSYRNMYKEYCNLIEKFKPRTSNLDNNLEITGVTYYNFSQFRKKVYPAIHGNRNSNWDYNKYPILDENKSSMSSEESHIEVVINSLSNLFDDVVSGNYILKSSYKAKGFLVDVFYDYFYDFWDVKYKNDSLGAMSTGKASFVILMLIVGLSKSKSPLLIDQPEDNLDNRSISTDLVNYIRDKKIERQIILVTHNPNIVVNADAENVIVADQRGQNDKKSTCPFLFNYINGAIENTNPQKRTELDTLKSMGIREHITEIVEGGEDAFRKREKKYGFK